MLARALALGLFAITVSTSIPTPAAPDPEPVRMVRSLDEGWRFVQDDALAPADALRASGADWSEVTLPHTWNAQDAASLKAGNYKRGVGWYRLEFDSPEAGARHWLEFGAASLVADVWLNGASLGQHKGGFTQFRFDVTDRLLPEGANVLLVRVDNSAPKAEDAPTAIAPLGGDFNVSGGLYRHVALVSTRDPVHIDLGDLGGPGVYARTASIGGGQAVVEVRTKLVNAAAEAGRVVLRAALLEGDGRPVQTVERPVVLQPGANQDFVLSLPVRGPRLWQGVEDPHLYDLVVDVVRDGAPIDRVAQRFGIREMRFDPNTGFFLNGRHVRLSGVAMHQDFLGRGWAVSESEFDESLALVKEVGANLLRLGHYPFPRYVLDKASEMGIVTWSEAALGLGTTVKACSDYPASRAFVENAKQQLRELIRQQYNHASVGMWSVGNETTARQNNCEPPYDNVRDVLRELHQVAKQEDPYRPTAYAEFGHPVDRQGVFATEGITDVYATNRYYGWYTEPLDEISQVLDGLHARAYRQSLGVSEYGAGAALSHHSDNPLGGPPDKRSAPRGETAFQPEEYASHVHEQNYKIMASKPYLWGTVVWNMFDFGSAHRNEGDVLGVNTKGLVTFDRKTRKDPFFFYKANWSTEPVTYIAGRRYTDRAYAVTDIKVYSNAERVRLSVNGREVDARRSHECPMATCLFRDVRLDRGENLIAAEGDHGGKPVSDSVRWTFDRDEVNIAAGWVATGYVSRDGRRFGSDHFFLGGEGKKVERAKQAEMGPENLVGLGVTQFAGTRDPLLYQHYRAGRFGYGIPLENGRYEVTLGFAEPEAGTTPGQRVFDVRANGTEILSQFDIVAQTGGSVDAAVMHSFPVEVSNGELALDFLPSRGEAVVSTIAVRKEAR